MSKKQRLSSNDYREIFKAAREAYREVKQDKRECHESYTGKVWAKVVVDQLYKLKLIDFSLDVEPGSEYCSIEE